MDNPKTQLEVKPITTYTSEQISAHNRAVMNCQHAKQFGLNSSLEAEELLMIPAHQYELLPVGESASI